MTENERREKFAFFIGSKSLHRINKYKIMSINSRLFKSLKWEEKKTDETMC